MKCININCNNCVVLIDALCQKCFYAKYPDILESVAKAHKEKFGKDYVIKELC